ncbi:MAG: hypothetical protein GY874_04530 [Desulfobacteraceae bacterium]|nr:hypothetical protein [Desulfobacteraceae bacterium]
MFVKHPINSHRLRKTPKQFNWVDHRLVRDCHIDKCSHSAAALYLLLVTVADAKGLSYYSDASIMARLSMDGETFEAARANLIHADLIAFKKPLYQVLSLDMQPTVERTTMDRPLSLNDILKRPQEAGSD